MNSGKSHLLTKELAHDVLTLLRPAILKLIDSFGGSQGLVCICVGTEKLPFIDREIGSATGDWKYPYDDLARTKAVMSLREKMGTGDILGQPWRLEKDDVLYRGGIYKEGLAVGVSGLEEDEDVLIARLIIETIIMVVKRKSKELSKELAAKNVHFLP